MRGRAGDGGGHLALAGDVEHHGACQRQRAAAGGNPWRRITVLAAFCGNSQLLASVRGWVAKVDGPADRRFRHLLGQITRELFGNPA